MKLSKPTKSNSQHKVLRMIARNEQLERFDGKFVAMNRKYKDRSKYNRKDAKRELRRDLRGSYCIYVMIKNELFSTKKEADLSDLSDLSEAGAVLFVQLISD